MIDHQQRQRAPFVHASSSADLTSAEVTSPLRYPPFQPSTWKASSSSDLHVRPEAGPLGQGSMNLVTGIWQGRAMARKSSDDMSNELSNPSALEQSFTSNGYISENQFLEPLEHHHAGSKYLLDTPPILRRAVSNASMTRTPSPNPFAIPKFSFPGLATIRFVCLCTLWYTCSALSSNTGKVILNNFRYPVTLTIVQFFFAAGLCVACSRPELGWTSRLRSPTKAILRGTLPMAAFQVGGHIFGSLAISRVPVSTVHTIKALSPLFTVLAYAFLFGVSYSPATYLSLLPLTLGVMLACSFDLSLSNTFGLICAFGSTLVFVSQNIFFKRVMPTNAETSVGAGGAPKLDKINLLYFSSGLAFTLMIPVWLYSDARRLIKFWLQSSDTPRNGPSVPMYIVLNGVVHFAQNLLAFAILSSTSPVTYSIASLVKRIAVICLAIIWFKQSVHPIQAMGICLTGVGLLMYNNAKRDVEKGEKKMRHFEAVREGLLPMSQSDPSFPEDRHAMHEPMGLGFGLAQDIHNSPRPVYSPGFSSDAAISKSSAVRPTAYPFPPPQQATFFPSCLEGPYPSPTASVASVSLPLEPASTPSLFPRHRRLSVDVAEQFRPPGSAGGLTRPLPIHAESLLSGSRPNGANPAGLGMAARAF